MILDITQVLPILLNITIIINITNITNITQYYKSNIHQYYSIYNITQYSIGGIWYQYYWVATVSTGEQHQDWQGSLREMSTW